MAVASNALRPSVQQNHQYKSRLVSSTTPSALDGRVSWKQGKIRLTNNLSNETEETSEVRAAYLEDWKQKAEETTEEEDWRRKDKKEQREEVSSEDA